MAKLKLILYFPFTTFFITSQFSSMRIFKFFKMLEKIQRLKKQSSFKMSLKILQYVCGVLRRLARLFGMTHEEPQDTWLGLSLQPHLLLSFLLGILNHLLVLKYLMHVGCPQCGKPFPQVCTWLRTAPWGFSAGLP